MKKLLQSSIVLLIFACSMFLFQVSCKKESTAKITNTTGTHRIAMVVRPDNASFQGAEIWLVNTDGSNQTKVIVSLPSNLHISDDISITNDGSKLMFTVQDNTSNDQTGLYTCNLDGSNPVQVFDLTNKSLWNVDSF